MKQYPSLPPSRARQGPRTKVYEERGEVHVKADGVQEGQRGHLLWLLLENGRGNGLFIEVGRWMGGQVDGWTRGKWKWRTTKRVSEGAHTQAMELDLDSLCQRSAPRCGPPHVWALSSRVNAVFRLDMPGPTDLCCSKWPAHEAPSFKSFKLGTHTHGHAHTHRHTQTLSHTQRQIHTQNFLVLCLYDNVSNVIVL